MDLACLINQHVKHVSVSYMNCDAPSHILSSAFKLMPWGKKDLLPKSRFANIEYIWGPTPKLALWRGTELIDLQDELEQLSRRYTFCDNL